MVRTRAEINFTRLLNQCENMIEDNKEQDDWRIRKYVESLEERLEEIKKGPNRPSKDVIDDYSRRVNFIKKLLQAADMGSSSEKVVASSLVSHGAATTQKPVTKKIHQTMTARFAGQQRDELFSTSKSDTVRKRTGDGVGNEGSTTEDLDSILRQHHVQQEKLAEDMLLLARNLKEHSLIAGNIIKKDKDTLNKTSTLTDHNYDQLQDASNKLSYHADRACKCWVWLLLILVFAVFVSMVMFMKLFKKRVS